MPQKVFNRGNKTYIKKLVIFLRPVVVDILNIFFYLHKKLDMHKVIAIFKTKSKVFMFVPVFL